MAEDKITVFVVDFVNTNVSLAYASVHLTYEGADRARDALREKLIAYRVDLRPVIHIVEKEVLP